MKLLKKFWNWLTTSAKRKPNNQHPELYTIDVDEIALELNLLGEAARLGTMGLPTADATVLSGPEAAALQRVEKARQDYVDWGALRLNILNQDIGRRNITQNVNRASQADEEFVRKADTLLTEQHSLLQELSKTATRHNEELEKFKTEHALIREADFPTKSGTFLRYTILLLLIVIEGIINSKFFAQGMDSGLIGGFSIAALLATFNISCAFIFGKFFIKYINHSKINWKASGLISFVLALVLMILIALGIAQYRDSLVAEASEPAVLALKSMLTNPFHLYDIFSWILFAISITFGLAALFDGLYSDDLYPGYGAVARRTKLSVDDYEDTLDSLREDLEELKNGELASLDNAVQQSQASISALDSLIDDKIMTSSRLSTALLNVDNSLEALLQKFRIENEVHRKGLKRPIYFDQLPCLKPIAVPNFNTETDKTNLASQHALVNTLMADVETIRARIQAAFNLKFNGLKPLDTHFPVRGKKI